MRERLRLMGADILFLQEVVGHNAKHVQRLEAWRLLRSMSFSPKRSGQRLPTPAMRSTKMVTTVTPFSRATRWSAVTTKIFRPIASSNGACCTPRCRSRLDDESALRVRTSGLFGRSRRKQVDAVCARIDALVPADAPLIVAGDFNDWRHRAGDPLADIGVREVFESTRGRPARSFPARLPILRLDRIYVRGFHVQSANVHRGREWAGLSIMRR